MPASESSIPLLQFWPTSNRTSRVVSSWIAPDYHPDQPNPLWDTRLANWERILYEDLQYAPQIQESLESKGFKGMRSEEHTSELQSLMRISYAVFCLIYNNTISEHDATITKSGRVTLQHHQQQYN